MCHNLNKSQFSELICCVLFVYFFSQKLPENPLTEDIVGECLSLLAKIGSGLAHAYVRLDVKDRYVKVSTYFPHWPGQRSNYIYRNRNMYRPRLVSSPNPMRVLLLSVPSPNVRKLLRGRDPQTILGTTIAPFLWLRRTANLLVC